MKADSYTFKLFFKDARGLVAVRSGVPMEFYFQDAAMKHARRWIGEQEFCPRTRIMGEIFMVEAYIGDNLAFDLRA